MLMAYFCFVMLLDVMWLMTMKHQHLFTSRHSFNFLVMTNSIACAVSNVANPQSIIHPKNEFLLIIKIHQRRRSKEQNHKYKLSFILSLSCRTHEECFHNIFSFLAIVGCAQIITLFCNESQSFECVSHFVSLTQLSSARSSLTYLQSNVIWEPDRPRWFLTRRWLSAKRRKCFMWLSRLIKPSRGAHSRPSVSGWFNLNNWFTANQF